MTDWNIVHVRGAQPIGDQTVTPAKIIIDSHYPSTTKNDLDRLRNAFLADAERIFNALRSLPGGTFDQLLILMLQKAASSFVVPHDFHEKERAGPKMFLVIERILQEIEFSKQNGTILNLGWIEANCKGVIEEIYPKTFKDGREGKSDE